MPSRVKYVGPYEAVRVAVANQGDVYAEKFVVVERGCLLPTETEDGETIAASVRDDLIKNNPDFAEVQQADPKKTSTEKGGE